MSKKRKQLPIDETKVKSEVITYREFFTSCLFKGLAKKHQEDEIHAFFKDMGLTDKESEDKYRDALAKY